GSGEGGQCPDAGESLDEGVGPGVRAGDAQPQLSGVAHDAGGDVEERQPQTFAPAAAELVRQEVVADPAGHVVGQGAGVPPQPVPEEVADRGVDEPEVLFELTDGVFGDPAPQPVMRLHFGCG